MKALLSIVSACIFLGGCSTASTIKKVTESRSAFGGDPEIVKRNTEAVDLYRVYHRAATGFVPLAAIRNSAEKRATEFCTQQGKTMEIVNEQNSNPPYILGNFPRIEVVFACTDSSSHTIGYQQMYDSKYIELANLKKLLDNHVITQDEFAREKQKIFDKP